MTAHTFDRMCRACGRDHRLDDELPGTQTDDGAAPPQAAERQSRDEPAGHRTPAPSSPAPWIAEAERAVLTTWDSPEHGYLVQRGLVDERDAATAVAAVVPILAEHFAQVVEAFADMDGDWIGPTDPDAILRIAARVIREAATPTEGGTT